MSETKASPDQESVPERSLLDFFIILLKYKTMIFSIVMMLVFVGMASLYLWDKKNVSRPLPDSSITSVEGIYYSECLIEPEPELLDRLIWLINRKNFILQIVQESHLEEDILKAMQIDEKGKTAIVEKVIMPDIFRWARSNLFITTSGKMVTIGFTAPLQDLPPRMISGFLQSISEYLRKLDLARMSVRKIDLSRALTNTKDPFLKARLSEEMVRLLGNESRAKNEKYYRFELLDPPTRVEKVRIIQQGKDKKVQPLEEGLSGYQRQLTLEPAKNPNYVMLFFLILLASLVVAVSAAFFLEAFEKNRQKYPEKIELLKRYSPFRRE